MQVEGIPTPESLDQLENGVVIQGVKTLPAKARLLDFEPELETRNPPVRFRKSIPTAWLEIKIKEGKNRQIRKMTAYVGYPTLRLVRVKIKHIGIDQLKPGEYRFLTNQEVKELMK